MLLRGSVLTVLFFSFHLMAATTVAIDSSPAAVCQGDDIEVNVSYKTDDLSATVGIDLYVSLLEFGNLTNPTFSSNRVTVNGTSASAKVTLNTGAIHGGKHTLYAVATKTNLLEISASKDVSVIVTTAPTIVPDKNGDLIQDNKRYTSPGFKLKGSVVPAAGKVTILAKWDSADIVPARRQLPTVSIVGTDREKPVEWTKTLDYTVKQGTSAKGATVTASYIYEHLGVSCPSPQPDATAKND